MRNMVMPALIALAATAGLARWLHSEEVEPAPIEEVSLAAPPHDSVRILRRALPQPESTTLPVFAGYEADWHQMHDAMIVRVVDEFNQRMGWYPGHEDRLDPSVVKAWALQESGGHREIFTRGDMMQMNNAGDWAPEKEWFGVQRGERLSPEESLRAALQWAYYKGEETRPIRDGRISDGWYPTLRGGEVLEGYESRFTSWTRALTRYNGGGVADYHGDIMRRLARST